MSSNNSNFYNHLYLSKLRIYVYRWLASLFSAPIKTGLLLSYYQTDGRTFLADVAVVPCLRPLATQLRDLSSAEDTQATALDLSVAYSKLFLGVDAASHAMPVQSAYYSFENKSLAQRPMAQMNKILQALGLCPHADLHVPADHLSIELAVMAEFAQQLQDEDACPARQVLLDMQAAFLREHLLAWVTHFAQDVQRFDAHGFYSVLAQATHAWIAEDIEFLAASGARPSGSLDGFLEPAKSEGGKNTPLHE